MAPKTGWHLQCGGRGCEHQFVLGFVLWKMQRGYKRPIDAGLPLLTGETGYLLHGQPANRAYSTDPVNI
jgi:hypothetical protein